MDAESGILGGCIVPHPPLLVPEIGGRDVETVRATQAAMRDLGVKLAELRPEVLIMISPHTPIFRDAFTVKAAPSLEGGFASFGRPQVRISKKNDVDLVASMVKGAEEERFPLVPVESSTGRWYERGEDLDHGLLVPLYYLDQYLETPIVSLSISALDYESHVRLGRLAAEACRRLGRRAFFVASGDLSHRLIKGAPAGYDPRGQEFDEQIVEIAKRGDFVALYELGEDLVEAAGECGLRSIYALWGAVQNGGLQSQVLSYEGPFGVGYMVSIHLLAD